MLKHFARTSLLVLLGFGCFSCIGCSTVASLKSSGMNMVGSMVDPALESRASAEYAGFVKQKSYSQENDEAQRIREVANRIIKAVDVYETKVPPALQPYGFQSARDFKWEVNLVKDPSKNAFCMPGGKIAVFDGILPIAGNDDGLAIIIGHEVAHALLRHSRERIVQQMGVQLALSGLSGQLSPEMMKYAGMGANMGLMLPWSRGDEREADDLGMVLAIIAGYNASEGSEVWKRMQTAHAGQEPAEFMSTHPSTASRIVDLKRLADRHNPVFKPYIIP